LSSSQDGLNFHGSNIGIAVHPDFILGFNFLNRDMWKVNDVHFDAINKTKDSYSGMWGLVHKSILKCSFQRFNNVWCIECFVMEQIQIYGTTVSVTKG